MAQPFVQLLVDMAENSELREAFEEAPYDVGKEHGLSNRQIGILIRGNLNEIQREATREAKEAGVLPKKAVVIVDR